jgi:hypothetical protein
VLGDGNADRMRFAQFETSSPFIEEFVGRRIEDGSRTASNA